MHKFLLKPKQDSNADKVTAAELTSVQTPTEGPRSRAAPAPGPGSEVCVISRKIGPAHFVPHKRSPCPTSGELGSGHPIAHRCAHTSIYWGGL